MRAEAITQAVEQTRRNLERFGDRFPHVSTDGARYTLNPNTEWTAGFWTGILWLCYEYTGDELFHTAAVRTLDSFEARADDFSRMQTHDIGFLYSLSAKAGWIVAGDKAAHSLALRAADALMGRWRSGPQLLQAWGREGDPHNGARIIIDCLMNLPLLYWASQETGDESYRAAAELHADKSRRYLVRGDDSSYHTFYFDPETGNPVRGATHQGAGDGTTWTRGQAWGIYGFALAYRASGRSELLETSRRMSRYFLDHLPDNGILYWDFDVPQVSGTKLDSSASAIAAAGLLELAEHLAPEDPDRERFIAAARMMIDSLTASCIPPADSDEEGFIRHGSYSVRGNSSPDDYTIWGDYFYLEALMRLERGVPGYWYSR